MWTTTKRIIRSGFVGFWRNAFVSLAAIFVMTITLLMIGGMVLIGQILDTSLAQIEEKVDINVYFAPTAGETEIATLREQVAALPNVVNVVYTTREAALAEFKERHKNNVFTIQALEQLEDNPLGASIAVQAAETTQYEAIAEWLASQKAAQSIENLLIDRINYFQNKPAIDKLTNIIHAVDRTTVIVMIILVAASMLITFNTIRLAIYTMREEISVMRLVGAGNAFIRGPFMLQGVLYGVVAGAIALLILYPTTLYLSPFTEGFFQFNLFAYYVQNFSDMLFLIVGTGIGLGVFASLLAVARYLRV